MPVQYDLLFGTLIVIPGLETILAGLISLLTTHLPQKDLKTKILSRLADKIIRIVIFLATLRLHARVWRISLSSRINLIEYPQMAII